MSQSRKIERMPVPLKYPTTKKRSSSRIKSFFTVIAVVCVACAFCVFIKRQYNMLASVERRIAAINQELDEQKALALSLEHEKSIRGTAEYYEKIAREQLGLIYKNEIIFKKR